jgi:hypothetical protein
MRGERFPMVAFVPLTSAFPLLVLLRALAVSCRVVGQLEG